MPINSHGRFARPLEVPANSIFAVLDPETQPPLLQWGKAKSEDDDSGNDSESKAPAAKSTSVGLFGDGSPSPNRRERRAMDRAQRKPARDRAAMAKADHDSYWIVEELREKLAKLRTREAVARCRSDLWDLPEIDFSRADLGLDEKTLAELRKEDKISGADLGRYAVGLFEDEHAAYFASRMVCPGLAFLRSPQQARELHGLKSKHPELDPFQCHSPGTYVIVVIYTNANGQPEAGVYVGAAYDQTVAERNERHDRRFKLLKAAEKVGDKDEIARLSDGQKGLYRRDTLDRYHFVLTRTSPPGVDAVHGKPHASSRWEEKLQEIKQRSFPGGIPSHPPPLLFLTITSSLPSRSSTPQASSSSSPVSEPRNLQA